VQSQFVLLVYAEASVRLPNARAIADWQLDVYVSSQNFIGGLKLT